MASISPKPPFPVRLAPGAATALALLVAAFAAVVALGSPAAASNHAVMIAQYAYSPSALTLDQGDTVTWTNHDSVQHDVTVTSGPATFHSPMLAQGQSWSFTFSVAGAYSYICSVHPDMRASVTVKAKAAATPKPTAVTKAGPATPKATTTAAGTAATHTATPKAPKAAAAAPPVAEVAAPAASEQLTTTPASTATLNPLLLVAGASTAVMVFCLLLMTSRPVARPEAATGPTED
ncbi:plastocyanin [Marmoricola sp. URHA0025 HA25]